MSTSTEIDRVIKGFYCNDNNNNNNDNKSNNNNSNRVSARCRHDKETLFALLALSGGPPVTDVFPSQWASNA